MRNKTIKKILIVVLLFSLTGCKIEREPQYTKYTNSFFDTFNTLTQVVAFTKDEAEFNDYYQHIQTRFQELHKLYDIYNNYEGINNIKTINDNAGIKPVKVEKDILDLILFTKEWQTKTGARTNIALGAVLRIWHDYRTEGSDFPEMAKIPPIKALRNAAKHTDMNKVIIDVENSTIFLSDKEMSLDVGSVAKGFATERIAKEVMAVGLASGIISAGGNVRVIGKPMDGRESWGIGIQDPSKSIVAEDGLLDTVFVKDVSVVSSGDYQRFYIVDGKVLHHIIDPDTLMPGEYYSAITVVAQDSGLADFMSTTLFLLPFEKSVALAESFEGVDALWVLPDGSIKVTEGMKKYLQSEGATNPVK